MSVFSGSESAGLSPSPVLISKSHRSPLRYHSPQSSADKSSRDSLSLISFQRHLKLHLSSPNWTPAIEDMDRQGGPGPAEGDHDNTQTSFPGPCLTSNHTREATPILTTIPVLVPLASFRHAALTDHASENDIPELARPTISALPDLPFQDTTSAPDVKIETAPDAKSTEYPVDDILDIATKMFKGEFVSLAPEEYTLYLAGTTEESTQVRECFMSLFTWHASLLESTRILCARTYLKAESQEIDRIVTSFTRAYLAQYPHNVFGTCDFEKIYVVVYLMILLNTALHNSNLSKKSKMTQQEYVRSTFLAFQNQGSANNKSLLVSQRIAIERTLAHYYDEISTTQLQLKQSGSANADFSGNESYHRNAIDSHVLKSTKLRASTRAPSGFMGSPRTAMVNGQWSGNALTGLSASIRLSNLYGSTAGDMDKQKRVGLARALASDSKPMKTRPHRHFTENSDSRRSFESLASSNVCQSPDLRYRASRASFSLTNRDFNTPRAEIFDNELVLLAISFDYDGEGNDARQMDSNDSDDFDYNIYHDSFDLQLELQGSPYLKEGLLKLQIQNNDQQDFADLEDRQLESSNALVMSFLTTRLTAKRFMGFFTRNGHRSDSVPTTEIAQNAVGSRTLALTLASRAKFSDYFVVVTKATLTLYSFDPRIVKKRQEYKKRQQQQQQQHSRPSTSSRMFSRKSSRGDFWYDLSPQEEVVGDGNWLNNAVKLGKYNLCSTFATLVAPPAKVHKPLPKAAYWLLTFARTLSKPAKIFLFEAGTREIAMEFVNTCNFWAARITAVPTFEESISSIEYGWTDMDGLIAQRAEFKKLKAIELWKPESQGVYLSNYMAGETLSKSIHLRMERQFVRSMNYYQHTATGYADFVKMKERFITEFPSLVYLGQNHSRVLSNFDAKKLQYKIELRKYKVYMLILGYALHLRFMLQDQELQQGNRHIAEDGNSEMTETIKAKIAKMLRQHELKEMIPNYDQVIGAALEFPPQSPRPDIPVSPLPLNVPTLMQSISEQDSLVAVNSNDRAMDKLELDITCPPSEAVAEEDEKLSPLVKLPKTFSFSECGENQSPLKRLVETSQQIGLQLPAISGSSKYMSSETIAEERVEEDGRSNSQGVKPIPKLVDLVASSRSDSMIRMEGLVLPAEALSRRVLRDLDASARSENMLNFKSLIPPAEVHLKLPDLDSSVRSENMLHFVKASCIANSNQPRKLLDLESSARSENMLQFMRSSRTNKPNQQRKLLDLDVSAISESMLQIDGLAPLKGLVNVNGLMNINGLMSGNGGGDNKSRQSLEELDSSVRSENMLRMKGLLGNRDLDELDLASVHSESMFRMGGFRSMFG